MLHLVAGVAILVVAIHESPAKSHAPMLGAMIHRI